MPTPMWPDETRADSIKRGAVVVFVVAVLIAAYVLALRLSARTEIVLVREKLPVAPSVLGRSIYQVRTNGTTIPVSKAFYEQVREGRRYEVQTRGIVRRGISRMVREMPE